MRQKTSGIVAHLATIPKSKRSAIRIALVRYGTDLAIDIRMFVPDPDGGPDPIPTPKGVRLPVAASKALALGIQNLHSEILRRGLITPEDSNPDGSAR